MNTAQHVAPSAHDTNVRQGISIDYDPNFLLDKVCEILNLKNDAALSRTLGVSPPVISKIRHFRLPVGAGILIRLHEATGVSIKELRALMGDHRENFTSVKIQNEMERSENEKPYRELS